MLLKVLEHLQDSIKHDTMGRGMLLEENIELWDDVKQSNSYLNPEVDYFSATACPQVFYSGSNLTN